jgi:hypothetical protein
VDQEGQWLSESRHGAEVVAKALRRAMESEPGRYWSPRWARFLAREDERARARAEAEQERLRLEAERVAGEIISQALERVADWPKLS